MKNNLLFDDFEQDGTSFPVKFLVPHQRFSMCNWSKHFCSLFDLAQKSFLLYTGDNVCLECRCADMLMNFSSSKQTGPVDLPKKFCDRLKLLSPEATRNMQSVERAKLTLCSLFVHTKCLRRCVHRTLHELARRVWPRIKCLHLFSSPFQVVHTLDPREHLHAICLVWKLGV